MSAQQLEEFSELQHEMQAEQQQQQPGVIQHICIAKRPMQHLRQLQPSHLEQQNDSGSENRPDPNSESDDGLSHGRGKEDRCIAACCSILPLCSSCNLTGPCIQEDKSSASLLALQELRGRG